MTNVYNPGSAVHLSVVFTDITNNASDPSGITLKVRDPLGNETSYVFGSSAMVKDSTGNYHYDLILPLTSVASQGTWYYRWEGTGTVTATFEGEFLVLASKIV